MVGVARGGGRWCGRVLGRRGRWAGLARWWGAAQSGVGLDSLATVAIVALMADTQVLRVSIALDEGGRGDGGLCHVHDLDDRVPGRMCIDAVVEL